MLLASNATDLDAKLDRLGARTGTRIVGILWQRGRPRFVEAVEPIDLGVRA